MIEKETVNSNVLSLNLKLFQRKVDIKSVIRNYLLRNYVVSLIFEASKLSKRSFEISEDPMFLGNKLPRSDAHHVNS